MPAQQVEVVWFKRDLRVRDHAPLAEAAARGPVLPLYIVEPSVRAAPDSAPRHWDFLCRSLVELRENLRALGQPLVVRPGEAVEVFEQLSRQVAIRAIHAHEETGNGLTYARDLAVARWARASGVEFRETPSGGVVRRLPGRDGWARRWEQRMAQPIVTPPGRIRGVALPEGELPPGAEPLEPAGEAAAHATLDSFLAGRGARYHREMSSPVTAGESCSRLSAHLAYGTISTRQVVQRLRALRESTGDRGLRQAWRAFDARLHWRDHFMQKLEDEPAIEFHNFVRGLDGLREPWFDAGRYAAWCEGRTGYPMVDACMRCLHATGWINFRMRAMLMSFASYHLWLHWRETGLHLARLFTDYEPGIHWSQAQMQSGTTGINTLRIYNPVKQAQDHDPGGVFLRRWLPELRDLPDAWLAQPWQAPLLLTGGYPAPIVDHTTAVRQARARLAEFRRKSAVRAEIQDVSRRHGSRRKPADRRPKI